MVLIHISLINDDVEIFLYAVAFSVTSLMNCLFRLLGYF